MKICIFVPAYNTESTIQKVLDNIPKPFFEKTSEILVIDNASTDKTSEKAVAYGNSKGTSKIKVIKNAKNLGYGGSQKEAYNYCLQNGFDMVIMLHGDLQYPAEMVDKLAEPIESGEVSMVLGSRIAGDPLKGGMPLWKYVFNRFLTGMENITFGLNLSEYHSGFRAYSCKALNEIDFNANSNNYIFDQQIISQLVSRGNSFKEITIPTYYGPGSHKISFLKSVQYGFGILGVLASHPFKRKNKKEPKR